MKTSKIFAILTSLSIVLFLSFASIANTYSNYTGDITKASKNVTTAPVAGSASTENIEYSYLRFDVNDYITNSDIENITNNTFDYLRFDVNNFTTEGSDENFELPVNEYTYLHFDVNNYSNANEGIIGELPLTE
jgi:hypothetical protein